jgi:hypothetical protein
MPPSSLQTLASFLNNLMANFNRADRLTSVIISKHRHHHHECTLTSLLAPLQLEHMPSLLRRQHRHAHTRRLCERCPWRASLRPELGGSLVRVLVVPCRLRLDGVDCMDTLLRSLQRCAAALLRIATARFRCCIVHIVRCKRPLWPSFVLSHAACCMLYAVAERCRGAPRPPLSVGRVILVALCMLHAAHNGRRLWHCCRGD